MGLTQPTFLLAVKKAVLGGIIGQKALKKSLKSKISRSFFKRCERKLRFELFKGNKCVLQNLCKSIVKVLQLYTVCVILSVRGQLFRKL